MINNIHKCILDVTSMTDMIHSMRLIKFVRRSYCFFRVIIFFQDFFVRMKRLIVGDAPPLFRIHRRTDKSSGETVRDERDKLY